MVRIYKSFLNNLMEVYVYLNLITLSGLTLAKLSTPGVVNSMIGIVFAVTIATTVYYFHTTYTAGSAKWLKVKEKAGIILQTPMALFWGNKTSRPLPFDDITEQAIQIAQQMVSTKTVIDLREPLLENDL